MVMNLGSRGRFVMVQHNGPPCSRSTFWLVKNSQDLAFRYGQLANFSWPQTNRTALCCVAP